MALGLLRALYERGRAVPDDVSVVGFDDMEEAAHFWPPLTTVRQTFAEVGLSYEFDSAFAVYGGLRFQDLDTKLEFASGRVSDSKNWVDRIVGGRWSPLVA